LILDSSAVVSVLLREQGHAHLTETIDAADLLGIGAPTLFETCLVMIGVFDLHGRALVSQFMEEKKVVVIPFEERHGRAAIEAFIRFGKGRHRAALNYGDCMTYAIASLADEPLLFVGDDFAETDLASALA
jgi:ribonuclease VapC